jgi:glycosyltransferase involved in cell wall biosynthesis
MTILLIDSASQLGGAQRSLLELAVALQARGIQVHAAVPAGPLAEGLLAAGVPVRRIPAVRLHRSLHPRMLLEAARFVSALFALVRAVRAVRPEIIHANGLTPALLAIIFRYRRLVVWHVRDLNMRFSAVRYLARRVACMVGISEPVAEHLTEIVPTFQLRKVRLIRNGIDTGHFCPGDRAAARRMFQLPVDAPLVGMAAHLVPWKRHRFFLTLAAAIHQARGDVQFVIAGRDLFRDHPKLRAGLEEKIAASGLSGSLTWVRDLDDLAPLLPALDVLVHPAANEPFGRVLCEAMASGIPVVAATSAGPGCVVPNGVAGHLVHPGDADAFARQALQLINQPDAARRMGAAGRQHVLDKFDVKRTAAELHTLFDKLLAQQARDERRRTEDSSRRLRRDADDD